MRKMIVLAAVLGLAAGADAAQSPGQKCQSSKNQEAGRYASCLSRARVNLLTAEGSCSLATATDCHDDGDCPLAEACSKDLTKYAAALTKCSERFEAKWGTLTDRALDAGDACPDGLVSTDIRESVDEHIARLAARLAGERFVDNGDGTISDNGTGLTWAKKSDDGSIHDQDNTYTWGSPSADYPPDGTAFTDYIARLNGSADGSCFAGHCDWRMPTIEELQGLVLASEAAPTIDPIFKSPCTPGCTVTACSCTRSDYYWSASTYAPIPAVAWSLFFYFGSVSAGGKSNFSWSARAVRGGS